MEQDGRLRSAVEELKVPPLLSPNTCISKDISTELVALKCTSTEIVLTPALKNAGFKLTETASAAPGVIFAEARVPYITPPPGILFLILSIPFI